MSGNELMVATDENQILTHEKIIDIGECLRQQCEEEAEDKQRRAVRCTEEVVRREETQKREQELASAEEKWKKERQQLFKEAHQGQLRALAKHGDALEKKLTREFAATLERVQEENRAQVRVAIKKTWEEAEEVKKEAIRRARLEEQAVARDEARKKAESVAEERKKDMEEAEREKDQALEDQLQFMEAVQRQALLDQEKRLREEFEKKLVEVRGKYETQLSDLEASLETQLAAAQRMEQGLQDMTALRDDWQQKHETLKKEFSDFIDQFPGFRGEFLV